MIEWRDWTIGEITNITRAYELGRSIRYIVSNICQDKDESAVLRLLKGMDVREGEEDGWLGRLAWCLFRREGSDTAKIASCWRLHESRVYNAMHRVRNISNESVVQA